MSDKQDQPKQESVQEAEHDFFFPNVDEGKPFSCKATSLAKAEIANADYLKQQKASK